MFFVVFWARKMGMSVYTLNILQFCDVVIIPLSHARLVGLGTVPTIRRER